MPRERCNQHIKAQVFIPMILRVSIDDTYIDCIMITQFGKCVIQESGESRIKFKCSWKQNDLQGFKL